MTPAQAGRPPPQPEAAEGAEPQQEAFKASIVNYQHPDRDTAQWPPQGGR